MFSILCILLSLIKISSSFRSFIDRFNVYLLSSVFSRANGDIKSLVKIRILLYTAIDHIIDWYDRPSEKITLIGCFISLSCVPLMYRSLMESHFLKALCWETISSLSSVNPMQALRRPQKGIQVSPKWKRILTWSWFFKNKVMSTIRINKLCKHLFTRL